jgi:uncharacterized membrane protein
MSIYTAPAPGVDGESRPHTPSRLIAGAEAVQPVRTTINSRLKIHLFRKYENILGLLFDVRIVFILLEKTRYL